MVSNELFYVCCVETGGGLWNFIATGSKNPSDSSLKTNWAAIVDCGMRSSRSSANTQLTIDSGSSFLGKTNQIYITHWHTDHSNLLDLILQYFISNELSRDIVVVCPPEVIGKPNRKETVKLFRRLGKSLNYAKSKGLKITIKISPIACLSDKENSELSLSGCIDEVVGLSENSCFTLSDTILVDLDNCSYRHGHNLRKARFAGATGNSNRRNPDVFTIPINRRNNIYVSAVMRQKSSTDHPRRSYYSDMPRPAFVFPGDMHDYNVERSLRRVLPVFTQYGLSMYGVISPHHGRESSNKAEHFLVWRLLSTGGPGNKESPNYLWITVCGSNKATFESQPKVLIDAINSGAYPMCLGDNQFCRERYSCGFTQSVSLEVFEDQGIKEICVSDGVPDWKKQTIEDTPCGLRKLLKIGRVPANGLTIRRYDRTNHRVHTIVSLEKFSTRVVRLTNNGIICSPSLPSGKSDLEVEIEVNNKRFSGVLVGDNLPHIEHCDNESLVVPEKSRWRMIRQELSPGIRICVFYLNNLRQHSVVENISLGGLKCKPGLPKTWEQQDVLVELRYSESSKHQIRARVKALSNKEPEYDKRLGALVSNWAVITFDRGSS